MTLVHMVFFKFRPGIPLEQKETFVRELKKLKDLPSVKGGRLLVGGPSVTAPIEKSQGYEYALMSYHEDAAALQEYQVSQEHKWVTETHFHPYKEDLVRFDFVVDEEDEHLCGFGGIMNAMLGKS
ncbi:stress responsive A/B barrel domain protein [Microdochium bolleyi]|uniref:Stress responsive A/B barrel domain protein n=1 Tax=Microdochium bolleyi TaxID=196109 RepID=A0A136JG24_9PEZI|nr:stress responsive A/B barrel domain protein [Microdochium bolleyi]